MSNPEEEFPLEKAIFRPTDMAMAQSWLQSLEMIGPEQARLHLSQTSAGPGGSVPIGMVQSMSIGFVQQWLAWHDKRKSATEAAFRARQIFWTRFAALSALTAASAAVMGWVWTIATKS